MIKLNKLIDAEDKIFVFLETILPVEFTFDEIL